MTGRPTSPVSDSLAQVPSARHSSNYAFAYGAFALLALIWGFSYLLIKVADRDMNSNTVVLIRCATGTVTLLAIFGFRRKNIAPAGVRKRVPAFLLMALFSSVIPFVLISWGQIYVTTGLASILNSTTPLFTAIFAYWVTPAERPSLVNYLGVVLGFVGTGILLAPEIIGKPLRLSALAALAILVGAAAYAVAALGQRRLLAGSDVQEASLWQLALATLIMIPIALPTIGQFHFHPLTLAAVLLLGSLGSGFAYIIYYYLLNTLGGTRGASVTLVIPLTAVLWGVLLLGESITAPVLVGMAVILGGIVLTSRRRPAPQAALAKSA